MPDIVSNIPFLNNAKQGNNSIWRYLITIIISLFVASLVAGAFLAIFIVIWVLLFKQGLNVEFFLNQLLKDPLFLIVMVGLSFSISYLFLYLCVRFIHKKTFISIINTGNKVRWKKIGIGALAWLGIIVILDIISYLIDPGSFKISLNPQGFWILALLALIAFPIQASFEEVFFRGYLMQGISLIFERPWVVLLVTSLFFALLHWWNGGTVVMSLSIVMGTFIIGLMLGILTMADNGIELAIGVHIINNIYVSVIHSSPDGGLGNLPSLVVSPSDPYLSPVILALAAVILIGVLFRNRRED
ncbi:MAG TPA: type II CAAX endopeptidase family protein, partial [Methanobacteriaceae archaeon]|nr:type II CAAX endopeptidase family protein [Methanobacteriaceae archaeon]